MSKIELGAIGAAVGPGSGDAFVADVVELERLGYSTVWLTGGQTESLDQVAAAVHATERVRIATGIIGVTRFPAADVLALHADLAASHPGRFVVGLGGAHGAKPFDILNAYLDEIAPAIPASEIVLAALGPRMLGLARERASGAYPVLVTPEFVGQARETLGDDTTLAIDQLVVVDADPARARTTARQPLGFLGTMPAYQANFRRMGFSEEEISGQADRLVDALVAWGEPEDIAAHVEALQAAGADHVAVSVVAAPGASLVDGYRQLAGAVLG
jgi:probable F420-dependent oxidoreductase